MYLQITTKCNMKCEHCCYNCTMRGKHADFDTIERAIDFITDWDSEVISIGGGEPTLHPDFFEILDMCLNRFDYVWLATNGSQTETMYRLDNIIRNEDYPEYDCTCETEEERDDCTCWANGPEPITSQREDQLAVALSQDCYHDPIDERIVKLWKDRKYEIRDVTKSNDGVIAAGRAKKTGAGENTDGCVCEDILIRPDGKIKLCGCAKSPIIGDIINGIEEKWEEIIREDEGYSYYGGCYRNVGRAV